MIKLNVENLKKYGVLYKKRKKDKTTIYVYLQDEKIFVDVVQEDNTKETMEYEKITDVTKKYDGRNWMEKEVENAVKDVLNNRKNNKNKIISSIEFLNSDIDVDEELCTIDINEEKKEIKISPLNKTEEVVKQQEIIDKNELIEEVNVEKENDDDKKEKRSYNTSFKKQNIVAILNGEEMYFDSRTECCLSLEAKYNLGSGLIDRILRSGKPYKATKKYKHIDGLVVKKA